MLQKLNNFRKLWQNMGMRYVLFRGSFEIQKRLGLLKSKYPTQPKFQSFITLSDWKKQRANFFFQSKADLSFPKNPSAALKEKINQLKKGNFQFFNAAYQNIGVNYDWITNPESGFRYDIEKHWLDVNDFSKEAGDIKFVWEKSRFSYLLTIIRYDHHFEEDCAEWVFSEIDSWISANPINCGPNFKCSQEISLRMLNWLFALYYYSDSDQLTENRFQKIMHYCYWQLHHVRQNIHFSRIAVRNNHAITETLMLYLGGIFFPFFPNAEKWSKNGLRWLEEEIAYQIYEDGTFLQFSHNYHRVLVQLLTYALYLNDLNGRKFSKTFLERIQKTLTYLYQCQVEENGQLPNYGANDGALFFPLNDCEYRDYRPQLNALAYYFSGKDLYENGEWTEDRMWLNASKKLSEKGGFVPQRKTMASFPVGGYYVLRDGDTLTFIRCGSHKDRPSHADNLHLDIWYRGENRLRDSGTYKYNTDEETLQYFVGTKGHNTVTLGETNQMQKGRRFIWYNWSQAIEARLTETEFGFKFAGTVQAFQHLGSKITHNRKWSKMKGSPHWVIEDEVAHSTNLPIRQYWNVHPDFQYSFIISAVDGQGNVLNPNRVKHWYSSEYGEKEVSDAIYFETKNKKIKTTISQK